MFGVSLPVPNKKMQTLEEKRVRVLLLMNIAVVLVVGCTLVTYTVDLGIEEERIKIFVAGVFLVFFALSSWVISLIDSM